MGGAVEPFPSNGAAALTAQDVITIMQHAGFGEKQILEYGPKLRNDLASSGGTRIVIRNFVEAILAVHDDTVYVSTRNRGTFRYDLATKAIM